MSNQYVKFGRVTVSQSSATILQLPSEHTFIYFCIFIIFFASNEVSFRILFANWENCCGSLLMMDVCNFPLFIALDKLKYFFTC